MVPYTLQTNESSSQVVTFWIVIATFCWFEPSQLHPCVPENLAMADAEEEIKSLADAEQQWQKAKAQQIKANAEEEKRLRAIERINKL